MAEKKNAISYESIMKDLKAQIYFPVYILMGDESFYIDKLCDYITENVLQPEEKDFNQVILFGADTTASQVVDQCKGYPMMAEHRVVILKEAQNLKNFLTTIKKIRYLNLLPQRRLKAILEILTNR